MLIVQFTLLFALLLASIEGILEKGNFPHFRHFAEQLPNIGQSFFVDGWFHLFKLQLFLFRLLDLIDWSVGTRKNISHLSKI
ncbi:hypothetical protein BGP_2385 [Beggiatoa sp. PS]|nr:hypothetical protein BGP_2385 [Beggiatoa sp. PS]